MPRLTAERDEGGRVPDRQPLVSARSPHFPLLPPPGAMSHGAGDGAEGRLGLCDTAELLHSPGQTTQFAAGIDKHLALRKPRSVRVCFLLQPSAGSTISILCHSL